jgi:hypothetical protein
VLIGALTSYLATTTAERVRHRREMATRWDERKLATYIEYVALVKEAARAVRRQDPEALRDALASMEIAEQKRSLTFESLVPLAAPAAVDAAHEVNRLLWQGLRSARDPDSGTHPGAELVDALNVLHQCARSDLGIAAGL